jgi:hypothetical protein
MGYLIFVIGKSLELIAKLQGKKLIMQKGKKIPENWDENKEKEDTEISEDESLDNIVVEDMDNIAQWDVVMEFNKMTIHKLVTELLNLPPSLTARFEIEATRLQLGACLYNFKSSDCIQGCDEGSSDPFVEDEYDDDDDDDGNESNWYAGFMSSDEEFMDSNTEWEADEDDSSDGDYNEDDSIENFDITNVVGKNVESTADEDDDIQVSDSGTHSTLPSIFDGDGSEKDLNISEDNSGSGECVPENICRDAYETFGSEPCCDDTVSSSEDA